MGSLIAVFDFSPVKDIIEHGFTKHLAVDPKDHPILVTEPAWNTPANRERMAEIMFEDFQVPAFYISNNAVLSAYVVTEYRVLGLRRSSQIFIRKGDCPGCGYWQINGECNASCGWICTPEG